MRTLYLCGAGNPEGVRLALAVNRTERRWDRIMLLDDDPGRKGQSILGVEIVGPFAILESIDPDSAEIVNLVARTTVKHWAARQKLRQYGVRSATLIAGTVDTEGVEIGEDVIVYHNATLGPEASLGDGCVVFMGAVAGHESRLGRGCTVAANAVINARVQLGDGVYVGTNAAILPDVKVGPWATIGAGSVATCDVAAGATLMGVPGKVVLPLELKLKMGAFDLLPEPMRRELESYARPAAARPAVLAADAGPLR